MIIKTNRFFVTKPNKDEISRVMSALGKRSGARMTPEQRKERAKKAIATRWAKHKDKKA